MPYPVFLSGRVVISKLLLLRKDRRQTDRLIGIAMRLSES